MSPRQQFLKWCKNLPPEFDVSQCELIKRRLAYTGMPHREGNSLGGHPLSSVAIRNQGGC